MRAKFCRIYGTNHAKHGYKATKPLAGHVATENASASLTLRGGDIVAMSDIRPRGHVFHIHSMSLLALGHRDDAIRRAGEKLVVLK